MPIRVTLDESGHPVSPRFCRGVKTPRSTVFYCEALDGRKTQRRRKGERRIELAARPRPVQEYVIR